MSERTDAIRGAVDCLRDFEGSLNDLSDQICGCPGDICDVIADELAKLSKKVDSSREYIGRLLEAIYVLDGGRP